MSTWPLFATLGLAAGAVYAAIGVGVILVHRGSAVLSLALGAQAMFAAAVFVSLRLDGVLILPVIGVPGRIDLGDPWPALPAALAAVVVGVAIAVVAYLVVFTRLRSSPPVTRLIATVGLTVVLQGAAVVQFGTATRRAPAVLPDDLVDLFGGRVPLDRVWLATLVVGMGGAIALLYRYTRFGLATRAAAESEKGATLLGYSAARLGLLNWVLAAVMISVAGVAMSPIAGVNPFNYSLFVVPALAAALAARLRSFSIAIGAGLAIGMFEGVSVHIVSQRQVPALLLGGFDSIVPFLVIVGALVAVGTRLPDRGAAVERYHPTPLRPTTNRFLLGGLVIAAVLLVTVADSATRLSMSTSLFVMVLSLSVVVMTGYIGQVSLAQLSLAGFAAFMVATFDDRWGWPFPLSPIAAVVCTATIGLLVSLPALRIRGIQFAIVTLAAAVTIEQLLFRSPTFTGLGGVAHVDEPSLFGFEFGLLNGRDTPAPAFGVFVLLLTGLAVAIVRGVRNGVLGRRMLAVRYNERAAAAAGVDVAATKLAGAAVSSVLAGIAGLIFAYKNVDFSWVGLESSRGLQFLALAYLGGVASVGGATIAGVIAPSGLLLVALGSPSASGTQLAVTGIGLLVVTVRFPDGLISAAPWLRRQLTRLRVDTSTAARRRHDDDRVEIDVVQMT